MHFEGHFLGFQLIRMVRSPLREMPGVAGQLTWSFLHPGGAALRERLAGVKIITSALYATLRDARLDLTNDPLHRARLALQAEPERLHDLESQVEQEVNQITASALQGVAS